MVLAVPALFQVAPQFGANIQLCQLPSSLFDPPEGLAATCRKESPA